MDKAQFEREKQYGAAVAIAKHLLRCELISAQEYRELTAVLAQKYQPAAILSPNPLRTLAKEGE